jgi:hypothetical protein
MSMLPFTVCMANHSWLKNLCVTFSGAMQTVCGATDLALTFDVRCSDMRLRFEGLPRGRRGRPAREV